MTLSLTLPEPTVEVVTGRSTAVDAVVRNDGDEAQRVRLDVGGRAAPWVHVAAGPDEASGGWQVVGPGESRTVTLLVSPPGGAAVPGQLVPFTVRATSSASSRPTGSATGLVLVCAPVPVEAALVPAATSAPDAPSHVVELSTDDPSGVLVTLRAPVTSTGATVTVDPVAVRVQPGGPARADVVVRPRRPALWGPRQHPFEVVWETEAADGLARGTVTGRLDQPAFLPKPITLLLLLGLVGVLGLAVAVLWPSDAPGGGPTAAGTGNGTASSSASLPTGTDGPVRGPAAVVHTQLKAPDPAAARRQAEERAAAVQRPASTTAVVVDGGAVAGYDTGFWVVVVQGFPDGAAVRDYCLERRRQRSSCFPVQ